MGRIWKRKTKIIRITEEQLIHVIQEGRRGSSIRQVGVAEAFRISKSALARHVKGSKDIENIAC